MSLWNAVRAEPWGYCKSFDMPEEAATRAARAFLSSLMNDYAAARGKRRWAEKTPDNALYVPFLATLYPEARFVHIVRDGLDVAMSTSVVAPHRRGISDFLERNIGFGPAAPTAPNSPLAALLRWRHWNAVIEDSLAACGAAALSVSYERLVSEPEATVRDLTDFIEEPFEPAMLDYARARHDFPEWEWGSADVRSRAAISTSAVGRARRELPAAQYDLLAPLARADAAALSNTFLAEGAAAAPAEVELVHSINAFSAAMGLDVIAPAQAAAAAWLWRHGLAGMAWRGRRIFSTGPFWHPLSWVAALLGARVDTIGPEPPANHAALARSLGVHMTWHPAVPAGHRADALLAFEKFDPALLATLKPGGFALVAGESPESWVKHWPVPVAAPSSPAAATLVLPG
ncbi:MAG: sulfotransferase [Phycisphaeraceae bacterium]|nr:sulfotransferase [Phycisphaeraceae bacterium]